MAPLLKLKSKPNHTCPIKVMAATGPAPPAIRLVEAEATAPEASKPDHPKGASKRPPFLCLQYPLEARSKRAAGQERHGKGSDTSSLREMKSDPMPRTSGDAGPYLARDEARGELIGWPEGQRGSD